MHIAIAGNTGVGKTTLASLLAKHYEWETNYENIDENPYLDDFYRDMKAWSFNLQIFLLLKSYENGKIANNRLKGRMS